MSTTKGEPGLPLIPLQKSLSGILTAILVTAASGCGVVPRGLLYTNTVQPLCRDARGTGLGTKVGTLATKAFEIPTTRIDLSVEWSSRAIGDIAARNGMKTVYSCDIRREYYVLGIWRREEVIVYGD